MLLAFIVICIVCIVLQQFQLWKLRRTFSRVSDVAVRFLEARSNER